MVKKKKYIITISSGLRAAAFFGFTFDLSRECIPAKTSRWESNAPIDLTDQVQIRNFEIPKTIDAAACA